MSEKKIKTLRKKITQYQNDVIIKFFDSLKDVGLRLRLKVCLKLIFTNFKLFDKKTEGKK